MREHGSAEVRAIGAGAVNQAVKAVAIAVRFLEEDSIVIACRPQFEEIILDGQERTAIKFVIEKRM